MKRSIKAAAKRGDLSNAKTLAREIVRSQKAVNRLHTSKAQMNSVMMQMENQLAQVCARLLASLAAAAGRAHLSQLPLSSLLSVPSQQKVTGHMTKSTEVMKMMNKLTRVTEVSQTMQQLQQEMTKAGIIEEMVDGAMEGLGASDEEDAADDEVDKVMAELNAETFSAAASAPVRPVAAVQAEAADEEEDEEERAMRDRLAQIKST